MFAQIFQKINKSLEILTKEADRLTNYSYSLLAHCKYPGNYKLSCLDVIV